MEQGVLRVEILVDSIEGQLRFFRNVGDCRSLKPLLANTFFAAAIIWSRRGNFSCALTAGRPPSVTARAPNRDRLQQQ